MNNVQLEKLKEVIDKHLTIRGINVITTLTFNEDKKRFDLNSTNFQTFPAIHNNLHIIDFGSGLTQSKEAEYLENFWITVNVKYDGNAVDLFKVYGQISKTIKDDIFIDGVSHKLG